MDALRDRLGAGGFGYIDGREVISQRFEAGHHQERHCDSVCRWTGSRDFTAS